jgi:hypothetical protein
MAAEQDHISRGIYFHQSDKAGLFRLLYTRYSYESADGRDTTETISSFETNNTLMAGRIFRNLKVNLYM